MDKPEVITIDGIEYRATHSKTHEEMWWTCAPDGVDPRPLAPNRNSKRGPDYSKSPPRNTLQQRADKHVAGGEEGINPKDLIGLTKAPLRFVPQSALIKMAYVMALGAKKYGPYNWREKAVRYTVYLEAMMRHIACALDGEEIDPESGQPHVAHAMACAAILLDAGACNKLVDDRPTAGKAAEMIRELTDDGPDERTPNQKISDGLAKTPQPAVMTPYPPHVTSRPPADGDIGYFLAAREKARAQESACTGLTEREQFGCDSQDPCALHSCTLHDCLC